MATKQEIEDFIKTDFPQAKCTIDAIGKQSATIRHAIGFDELRPGGTVSGPTLMTIADCALYIAILGEIGIVSQTVTTSLTINFMRKPSAKKDIIAHCNLLKVGKKLAVGEVSLYSAGDDKPVAHVVGTYSIPQD
ncbi:PaaI family thioesterase [Colwellia ponticola]|uniref:PaaI family thioesterase n=1 Tax=Colwellia ponticola TaxID=2304625 RepID=A0A8H2JM05_9GAMM|nr:PaaI family thioesterase [Colwellia ponticola]TMM46332.1 PaaI family thioesterase [Colwellia ponticola]